jgi:hypothetical protein
MSRLSQFSLPRPVAVPVAFPGQKVDQPNQWF